MRRKVSFHKELNNRALFIISRKMKLELKIGVLTSVIGMGLVIYSFQKKKRLNIFLKMLNADRINIFDHTGDIILFI